jgi:hypothetical protein
MCSCEQRGNVFVVNSHRPSVRVPFNIFVFFNFFERNAEREREQFVTSPSPKSVFRVKWNE